MACPAITDVLRQRTEDLGPELYAKAVWRSLFMSLIKRGTWPAGRGYVASTFEIARSVPGSPEEAWAPIQAINGSTNPNGACAITATQAYVGELEKKYMPEMFWLRGPIICKHELEMGWNSAEFWGRYFERLEQTATISYTQRLENIYMNYVPKVAVGSTLTIAPGNYAVQPPGQFVDLSAFVPGGTYGQPTSELTQDALDDLNQYLQEQGADIGDHMGWITHGDMGPIYPLYIGSEASKLIAVNNPELRSDLNQAYMGWGQDLSPVLVRRGSTRLINNFRHTFNLFPPRWIYVPWGTTINYTATGNNSNSGTVTTYGNLNAIGTSANTNPWTAATWQAAGVAGTAGCPLNTPMPVYGVGIYVRIPHYVQTTDSTIVTKGTGTTTNGVWRDRTVTVVAGPQSVFQIEGALVLNPEVMIEEILEPINAVPGAKFNSSNYFGDWDFVMGNEAFLGFDGCTGIADPFKEQGRHFAQYRHAAKPIHPEFGAMLLYLRCNSGLSTVTCS